jgi:hypothetical protein
MCGPIASADAWKHVTGEKIEKCLSNPAPVEQQRFVLIVEGQEAFVTRGLTLRPEVVALFVEMAARERRARDLRERISLLDEPTEHAYAAFGCLVTQDRPVFTCANALGGELGFLELERVFASSLKGVLERSLQCRIILQLRAHESN